MKRLALYVVSCLVLFACKEPYIETLNVLDDDLLVTPGASKAAWWDTNTIYYFSEGNRKDTIEYSKKHVRTGQGTNVLTTDSVWGTMQVDTVRKQITFSVEGFMTKDSVLLDSSLNSTTWIYSRQDTFLKYESNTTLGTLTPYRQ